MIEKFIEEERLFQILFEDVNFDNKYVKKILLNYINQYIKFKGSSIKGLKSHYEHFLRQYTKDAKEYLKSNVYPALNNKTYNISREEYDVFLMLSTIFTQHRYDVMVNIYNILKPSQSALVIGSGVGIELELIKSSYKNISAYDIEIDKFCNHTHKEIDFYEEEFVGTETMKYDDIFIIELLEHIDKPYELLKNAKKALVKNGRIIITLAVNIPQFDHVFNFDDMGEFNKQINTLNLYIEFKKDIQHKYLMNGLNFSSNIFLILKENLE